jgi:hypothetical protein
VSATEDGTGEQDATQMILREGMMVDRQGLLALRSLMPKEVWQHRETFFFEGMRMLIGPCHRRYAQPDFVRLATERFAGKPKIDRHANLKDYTAGTPFPAHTIADDDPQAGVKWAWNFEKRFRGAGHRGRFRITSLPSRIGKTVRYRGDFFVFQSGQRADLADSDYAWKDARDMIWATGGYFAAPFSARELAWRQFRKEKSDRRWQQIDDIFVYVPTMRKPRRAATGWVAGAYVPRYSVAGDDGGGGIALGNTEGIYPTAGVSIASTEDARAGLTGLFLRPNAYVWRLQGERTVIAPLNGMTPGYPIDEDRNFGISGLSVASDRWDVRHAIVIEGRLRKDAETVHAVLIYLDYETLQPLYWITRTKSGRLIEVGILVHRFTGDLSEYPSWPNNLPTLVFEPVAASFFAAIEGSGGWLRESYDLDSRPFTQSQRKRMSTSNTLQRGR